MDIAGATCVWLGVAVMVVMSAGTLVFTAFFERLHYAGAVATPGALLATSGLALQADTWYDATKIVLIGGLLVVSGSVGTSVTARAGRATGMADGESS